MEERLPLRDAARVAGRGVRDAMGTSVPRNRRGVALLVVLVTVAMMSALSTEFAYNTRTNIWMAGNVTAETQAHYHARSALEIAELAVNAKRNFPQVRDALDMIGQGGGANLEVWRQACAFVKIFATGRASFFGMDILNFSESEAVGVNNGSFSCEVTAEDSRTNLNAASTKNPIPSRGGASGSNNPQQAGRAQRGHRAARKRQKKDREALGLKLYGLLRPFLRSGEFESEEEMIELITNIMDWTDADDTKTDVGPDGSFIESGGAEGAAYAEYDYEPKNAKMDTVGEVQLVDGMTSEIYCHIRDRLTVFSTNKLNVNDAAPETLKGVLCQALPNDSMRMRLCWSNVPGQVPPMDAALSILETCRQLKKGIYSTPFTSMRRFLQFFQKYPSMMGSSAQLPIDSRVVRQHLGVDTTMVRIEVSGKYRNTTHRISEVVDMDTGQPVYVKHQ